MQEFNSEKSHLVWHNLDRTILADIKNTYGVESFSLQEEIRMVV